MPTLAEIKAQMAELQRLHDEMIANEKANIISEIKQKIADFNLTAEDLGFMDVQAPSFAKLQKAVKAEKTKVQPLYRGPNNEEWSAGRGAKPKWVKEILEAGGNLEDYRIKTDDDNVEQGEAQSHAEHVAENDAHIDSQHDQNDGQNVPVAA